MKARNESGFHIISGQTKDDENLRAYICPNCGNTDEEIKAYHDRVGYVTVRCWGGFGRKKYHYLPHKCTSCGCKFVAWESSKEINGGVVGLLFAVAFFAALGSVLMALAITVCTVLGFTVGMCLFIILRLCCAIDESTDDEDKGMESIEDDMSFMCFDDDEDEDEDLTDDLLSHLADNTTISSDDLREVLRDRIKSQTAFMSDKIWKL
jgi:predicted RNA-binding Zn-ribbon protein involved in translation (DUF1610 family)